MHKMAINKTKLVLRAQTLLTDISLEPQIAMELDYFHVRALKDLMKIIRRVILTEDLSKIRSMIIKNTFTHSHSTSLYNSWFIRKIRMSLHLTQNSLICQVFKLFYLRKRSILTWFINLIEGRKNS